MRAVAFAVALALCLVGCRIPGERADRVVQVKLIAFNDFHGNLQTPVDGVEVADPSQPNGRVRVPAGGVEYLATQIDLLKKANRHHAVVAAGDIIGATPLISAAFHDEPAVEAMNLIGVDFSSVGNHEFDKGKAELFRMQNGGCHPKDGCRSGARFEGAKFRYLAANVIDAGTGQPLFPAYAVKSFDGINVAFVGVVLQGTPGLAGSPSAVAGLEFRDEANTVNGLVPVLQSQGIEAIVLLIHEGGFTTGLYNDASCPGMSGKIFDIAKRLDQAVDVVISAHTHRAYNCRVDGRLVTSAGAYGQLVTDIDVKISAATRDVVEATATNILVDPAKLVKEPRESALVATYDTLVAPIANRVVGAITAEISKATNAAGESAVGDLIADAQLAATSDPKAGGAQIAFMNPGGIRASIAYRALGSVTYGELFSVQPFGNSLITMSLTGAQLKQLLELQWDPADPSRQLILQVSRGFQYAWDSTRNAGDRVDPSSVKLNGVSIVPTGVYRVTVNSFLSYGGDKFAVLKDGTDRREGMLDLDALDQYMGANKPVAPHNPDRIVRR